MQELLWGLPHQSQNRIRRSSQAKGLRPHRKNSDLGILWRVKIKEYKVDHWHEKQIGWDISGTPRTDNWNSNKKRIDNYVISEARAGEVSRHTQRERTQSPVVRKHQNLWVQAFSEARIARRIAEVEKIFEKLARSRKRLAQIQHCRIRSQRKELNSHYSRTIGKSTRSKCDIRKS